MDQNPYDPPSACLPERTQRRFVRGTFLFSSTTILVFGVITAQRYFIQLHDKMQIELPLGTKACLNPIAPIIATVGLSVLAMTTLLTRRKRTRELCEVIFVVSCGCVIGYYHIALYLPWLSITTDLI
jgi:hypothetical protein